MTDARTLNRWPLLLGLALIASSCTKPTMVRAPETPEKAPKEQAPPTTDDVAAAADVAVVDNALSLDSKVTKVTVYSDRARLTREAVADLATESKVFAFRKLPGWVDDGSVRVSSSAGRILDVRVERSFLARATDEKYLSAEAHHQSLTDKLAALDDEIAVLDAQKKQIDSIKAFSLEKITKDTTIGDVSVKSYGDVLEFISDSLRRTAEARRAVQRKRAKLAPEVVASQRTLNEMKNLLKLEETTVLVTLQGSSATPATVELTYMMPGATWEPAHELRVSTSSAKTVEVISFAIVTQTSGEDWGNAEMSFSTQSSVKSVRIPELEALTLGDTHTATRRLTSKMSSFSRAQQAFYGQSQMWNKVHRRSEIESERFDQVYQSNMQYLQTVQGKTVRIFEKLQKRGTTAHFKANAAPSVRGDGHPVRMRIGRSSLKSKQRIVAAPEQSLNAARTLAMTNSTGQSFLPGKVSLYQDGAFLGMTGVDFIAKGESFSLFLSVADQLKLSRELDRKRSGLVRKRRNRMQVSFIVKVENLSASETSLNLADRIPVSENRAIKIDNVKISPSVRPDSRGILNWELTLKPKEVREFRISYRVEYPASLVLETQRKRQANPRNPARPAPRRKYKIEEQLLDLENML